MLVVIALIGVLAAAVALLSIQGNRIWAKGSALAREQADLRLGLDIITRQAHAGVAGSFEVWNGSKLAANVPGPELRFKVGSLIRKFVITAGTLKYDKGNEAGFQPVESGIKSGSFTLLSDGTVLVRLVGANGVTYTTRIDHRNEVPAP
jgi:hypothetical protein